MKRQVTTIMTMLVTALTATAQTPAAHFDMSLSSGNIKELVTGKTFNVVSQLPATTIAGPAGEALRFDGYSNYVKAELPTGLPVDALTLSVTLAAESYPMMQVDAAETTPTYATVCGNLDETAKRGFALQLSSQGDLRMKFYVVYGGTGRELTINGTEKLPRGQWCNVTMTYDKAGNVATLYLDGNAIGTQRNNRCDLSADGGTFYIGKDGTDVRGYDYFLLNTFCGAIDDIAIYNEVIQPSPNTQHPSPNFNYPAERYEGSLWHPQFHAMPSGSWTNESHGLIYSDGRWHLFFQKNANGPYMSRLHWGHLSSTDLCQWTEEPIALYPGEDYDVKGCWSGCVYDDNGTATLLYTAVDNGKARIAQAKAQDAGLVGWADKKVVIDGRPSGLSDDFRDPYYFEANGNRYIIVGTSKNGMGACTLHRWNGTAWTNDGSIFFQGTYAGQHGNFWEMPNVTPMGDGRWLFTCTPLGATTGVRTIAWVGTIGTDGTFTPTGNMQMLEMNGISRDGYGLLSPSICQKDGKTLLLGIVPDKLSAEQNYKMGWAHNFSLPREVSLAADGTLVQKPYGGLTALRTKTTASKELTLVGTESLAPVSGRQIELLGEFTIVDGPCGFHFLKHGDHQATLSYDPSTSMLTLDYTTLDRTQNGDNGQWSARLPKKVAAGETLKLHVYVDGSIVDVFVNDTWAFSTRLFPTDADATEAEVFAEASTPVKVTAWTLDGSQGQSAGIGHVVSDARQSLRGLRYNLMGQQVTESHKGIVVVNGKKYVAR